ncbi:12005_t:CDS:2 [Funneliformis caledonium]|uniref:12005_t:CDS:1 n=1 Tax=Funneliformis caledonium TaxID=1117310 RepID=A0A9N9CWP3_9GLOM|nr:12005_t:CDS:2 [Funneliformis caledonium]
MILKLFVTGGSGYLGRNFIQYALSQNENININALSRSSVSDEIILEAAGNIDKGRERIKIIRGHMNDENSLKEGLNGVNVIVHMAAKVQPYGYYEEHDKINVLGTSLLLSLVESLPTSNKPRFVHISSFTARLNDHFPIDSLPDWAPYSKSKCHSEKEILKSSFDDIIILRLGWLWGRDDNVLVPMLYNLCRNPIWKIIPKSQTLSITHITNACEAIYLSCITSNKNSKRVYEIEDNEGKVEMDDFLEFYVGSTYNINPSRPSKTFRAPRWLVWVFFTFVESIPLLGYSKTWIFDGMNRECSLCLYKDYQLDSAKAKEEIGYAGIVSREQGIFELAELAKKKFRTT